MTEQGVITNPENSLRPERSPAGGVHLSFFTTCQVNQHKHCRLPLATSSEEWTVLGTNPLLTPSQPSWILMSPVRTSSKMSLVRSTNAWWVRNKNQIVTDQKSSAVSLTHLKCTCQRGTWVWWNYIECDGINVKLEHLLEKTKRCD